MDREAFRRLEAWHGAAGRLPRDQREAYLDRVCAGEPHLRLALEALLGGAAPARGSSVDEAERAGQVEAPGAESPRTKMEGQQDPEGAIADAPLLSVDDYAEGPGDVFGAYELLDILGEGGFGTVYRARQSDPVEREVAFKILKLGMDSRQVVLRFEAERQLLARMDHPHIAKVHDAGVTDKGRPYFVMELVRGVPITQYCDDHALTATARVHLFAKVCQAVHHAHQRGVIHRDLKPSNVLVEEVDGEGVPRVIDFGIAKVTGSRDRNQTILTEAHQLIGTPDYMAPEQALGEQDIDTRADVYSLGVLLYELLTGTRPFDVQKLLARGFAALMHHIREAPAQKPSTRLLELGDARVTVAQQRGSSLSHLKRLVRGDLDWITLRALEKDRTRRYASAHELAEELQRFLRNEAVLAGPPSALYRIRKFASRHRALFTMACVILLATVFSLAALSWGLVQVGVERDRADEAARQARADRDLARIEARTAERVSRFLTGLFEAADPMEARGDEVKAKDLIDRGAERLSDLDDEPDVRHRLGNTLGGVYLRLGDFASAEPLLRAARRYFETRGPQDRAQFLISQVHLAELLTMGAGDPEQALPHARRAVEAARELKDQPSLRMEAWNALATALVRSSRSAEAKDAYENALRIGRESFGNEDPRIAGPLTNLGSLHMMSGEYEEAGAIFSEVIAIEEQQPGSERDFGFGTTLHLMAMVCENLSDFEKGIEYERRSLKIRETVLGEDHWHVALSLTTLGNLLRKTGNAVEARPLQERAVKIAEATFDAQPDLYWSQESLARTLLELGAFAEARTVVEREIEALQGTRFEASFLPLCLGLRGLALLGEGKAEEGESLCRRALERMEEAYGREDADRVWVLERLVRHLRRVGRTADAERLEREEGTSRR